MIGRNAPPKLVRKPKKKMRDVTNERIFKEEQKEALTFHKLKHELLGPLFIRLLFNDEFIQVFREQDNDTDLENKDPNPRK
ncbi:unnamed protein product [Allacma fusca]|uniref:Uncharacterized protein n=1 Tax=Allacma fusca TaxID=39272 RepID=A0A8J2LKM3_9HEXA|nr:unnamed protein product [Allacma fusca]